MGEGIKGKIWFGKGGRLDSGWISDLQKIVAQGYGFQVNWFFAAISKVVGNGSSMFFQTESWIEGGPLSERFPQLFSLSLGKEATMADLVCLKDGEGFGSGGGGEDFFSMGGGAIVGIANIDLAIWS